MAVGAVLNILVARLPRRRFSFGWPVRCRYCRAPLALSEVPALASYLFHGGKCTACGHRIGPRYLLVEIATGALFAGLYLRFGMSWPLLVYSLYASIFVIITMIDLEHRLILNVVTYPSILLGAALSFVTPGLEGGQGLLGGLFYGGLFLLFYLGAVLFYRNAVALGLGDVKLALFIGLVTGLRGAFIATLLGTLIGAAIGIWLMLFRGKSSQATMPYGPSLTLGAAVTILWSPWVG